MAMLMNLTTIFTGISTILLVALLVIYTKNLSRIKSRFTYGLFIFAILFLAQNLISLYYFVTMMDYYVPAVSVHVFIFSLLQAVAFAVLLFITRD
ncbi:hypothetical protein J4212_03890 [Candidatus Woesearchaeota archaeon]|nr:hypothetical protein [Candidatus Woesearchaeota archaeon]